MKQKILLSIILLFTIVTAIDFKVQSKKDKDTSNVDQRVDSVLILMTLDEKIGQLNQYNDDWISTGPQTIPTDKIDDVRNGRVGSILNSVGVERVKKWQTLAMESRLKIPLLFGQDVIHGYKTTFPIPLAESCSWDLEAMELSACLLYTSRCV